MIYELENNKLNRLKQYPLVIHFQEIRYFLHIRVTVGYRYACMYEYVCAFVCSSTRASVCVRVGMHLNVRVCVWAEQHFWKALFFNLHIIISIIHFIQLISIDLNNMFIRCERWITVLNQDYKYRIYWNMLRALWSFDTYSLHDYSWV